MYCTTPEEIPVGVVTVTFTVPLPAGLTAVICVELTTVNDAGAPPKLTLVAPLKFVPAIVMVVPPAAGPLEGLIPVMDGPGIGAV